MILIFDANQGRLGIIQSLPNQPQWHELRESFSLLDTVAKCGLNWSGVQGIMVIQGKGGFSQTREAVVIANTLSIYGNIATCSLTEEEYLAGLWQTNTPLTKDKLLTPQYYTDPNINQA